MVGTVLPRRILQGIPEGSFRRPPMVTTPPALLTYRGENSLNAWEGVRLARDPAMSGRSLGGLANPGGRGQMAGGQPPEGPHGGRRPLSRGDGQERPGGRALNPEPGTGAPHRGHPARDDRWNRGRPQGARTHQRAHSVRGGRSGPASKRGWGPRLPDTRGRAPAQPGHRRPVGPLQGTEDHGVIQARRIQTSADK